VAEDNSTNQQVALAILAKLGYRADAVANGREAVEAVQAIPYDLVLMDCQMPEMDGYEATGAIRRLPGDARAIPVIAMTANAMDGDRARCLEAGMTDYLAKPVLPQAVAQMLGRWLGRRATEPPPPDPPPAGPAVFDRDGLVKRLMGDADLAQVVVAGFLEDMPAQLAALAEAAARGQDAQVALVAHRIKGAAANVNAGELQAAALAAERAGKAGETDEYRRLLSRLREAYACLDRAMRGP
jgi:CheY-like chemotaxis protein/HPt (histidine-containing phosphotransfer) domain-containing protein